MPDKPAATPAPARRLGLTPFIFALLFALACFFQYKEGAYQSEFGGHPDEAGHYVTGLFVHDSIVFTTKYLTSGFHVGPKAAFTGFVKSYYDHYPKIGLGVWPPFFYIVQSAWSLPFSSSRISILLLMAALAASTGCVLFRAVEEEYGIPSGLAAAVLWLSLPLVQQYSGMVMAEMLSAVTMFSATLSFGRFLDQERRKDAVWFGVFASAAILTKGTGLALAFVPLFSILILRRFSLLKNTSLWIAAVIVAVVAGPWTFATRNLGKGGWEEPTPSLHFTRQAIPYYAWKLAVAVGGLILLLAFIGMIVKLFKRSEREGKWASCFALIIGIVIFQSIAPAGREARHLIPAVPAMLMFAIAGFQFVSGLLPVPAARVSLAVALIALFFGLPLLLPQSAQSFYGSIGDQFRVTPFGIVQKGDNGFASIAEQLAQLSPHGKYLVSSDASGEGMFIAEVAMHDSTRPDRVAARASKALSSSQWGGGEYKAEFQTPEELLSFLQKAPYEFIVVDTAIPDRYRKPHHDLLQKATHDHPEVFQPVGAPQMLSRAGQKSEGALLVYRVTGK